MANPFRDMSVIMQALVAAAIDKRTKLTQEVTQLSVYKQRYGELKQQMDALNKQLDTLKTIVPEEKETDEFIRQLQGAAAGSKVAIRQLKDKAVVPKDNNYYEMPFEIQADGPYFNGM